MKKIMNKVGEIISQTVDFLIDKNRQTAYLNRLNAIIEAEQETLSSTYIALGKIHLSAMEGKETAAEDAEILAEIVSASRLRLKKARARYEYVLRYGIPKPGIKIEETINLDDIDENGKKKEPEDQDITIAYADPTAEIDDDTLDAAIKSTIQEENTSCKPQE